MEVDHIFICVQSGAPEAETLKKFGLTEGSSNKHPGQGTENRRFFFKNSFIELIFL
ncbi:MAG TPA: glyoxalase-like domain protein, partial [Acinetobacter sp.]|nr:glyoxalase-like domain protein [Acinetobacter sp.]